MELTEVGIGVLIVIILACGAAIAPIPARRRRNAFEAVASANGFTYSPKSPELSGQSFFTLPIMMEGNTLWCVHNVIEGTFESTPFFAFEYVLLRQKRMCQFSVVAFRRSGTDDFTMSVQPTTLRFLPDLGLYEVPGLFNDSGRCVLVSNIEEFRSAKKHIHDAFAATPKFCCDVNSDWMVVYPVVVLKKFRFLPGSRSDVRVGPTKLTDLLNQTHSLFRAVEDS